MSPQHNLDLAKASAAVNEPQNVPEPSPGQMSDLNYVPEEQHQDVEKQQQAEVPAQGPPHIEYPSTRNTILIMIALYLAMFLVALDRTIIAIAIPRMTDDFHSFGDIGWYGSAYLLTNCAFQLLLGRVYTFYNPKVVFLGLVIIFEIGSAICGGAPNSTAFIFGRAIAGLGSAGIFSGTIIVMIYICPLQKRALYQGILGGVFGIASVLGPLLGGAFTTNVTWRWCFYINLPIGAVTFVTLFCILKLPASKKPMPSFREQLAQLDPIGTFCFIPSIVCLLLALQWGGSTYDWNDGRIIALLVLFGISLLAFIAVQAWKQDSATVPPRIILHRSIAAGVCFSMCIGASMLVMVYYLPLWFQAIKGANAMKSGIMNLPLVLSLVIASMTTGILVTRLGYYTPFMIISSILISVGAGLFTTFTTSTAHPTWIGVQVLFGYGIGCGMQQSGMAAQTVLERNDVPTGVSLMFFGQSLGGAVFISVGQTVLNNRIISGLSRSPLPDFDPAQLVNQGATAIRGLVAAQNIDTLIVIYNHALIGVFYIVVATTCFSIIGSLAMEWKSIKRKGNGEGGSGVEKLPGGDGGK